MNPFQKMRINNKQALHVRVLVDQPESVPLQDQIIVSHMQVMIGTHFQKGAGSIDQRDMYPRPMERNGRTSSGHHNFHLIRKAALSWKREEKKTRSRWTNFSLLAVSKKKFIWKVK